MSPRSGERILFVDDEPAVLSAYRRTLRQLSGVETASSGAEALELIAQQPPVAVLIADMHMPGMDGVALLSETKRRSPDTVRIMLTGASDAGIAATAVNQGEIFRFLAKPCQPESLARAVADALRHHRLVIAERSLLEQTLNGSISLLTDLLSLIDPDTFGFAEGLRRPIRQLCAQLGVAEPWAVEMAAMLAGIGRLTVPPEVVLGQREGRALSAAERDTIARIPEIGSMLLAQIPRLEEVGRIVLYQHKRFDGGGFPPDSVRRESIPIGARILAVVRDAAQAQADGLGPSESLLLLAGRDGAYDPAVIEAARACLIPAGTGIVASELREIPLRELRIGDQLRRAVLGGDGIVLVGPGTIAGAPLIERLANFQRLVGIREPLLIERRPQERNRTP